MNAKMTSWLALCGWILSTTACHRGSTSSGQKEVSSAANPSRTSPNLGAPTRPLPTVALEPVDLTTAASQAALHVRVSNLGAPVGSDLLYRIAQSVTLRTWPELSVIPTTVAKVVDATGKSSEDEFAHIYLAPTAALADRWYTLAMDVLPQGLGWASPANTVALANGGQGTRFRVGSGPMVASVRVYAKDAAKRVVHVDISEPVIARASVVTLTYVDGRATDCWRESDVTPPSGLPTAKDTTGLSQPANAAALSDAVTSIRLSCPGALDLQQEIRLDVQLIARATSIQGQAATSMASQLAIGGDAWVVLPDGGKMFKRNL